MSDLLSRATDALRAETATPDPAAANATRLRVRRTLAQRARGRRRLAIVGALVAFLFGGTSAWAIATGELAQIWRPSAGDAPQASPRREPRTDQARARPYQARALDTDAAAPAPASTEPARALAAAPSTDSALAAAPSAESARALASAPHADAARPLAAAPSIGSARALASAPHADTARPRAAAPSAGAARPRTAPPTAANPAPAPLAASAGRLASAGDPAADGAGRGTVAPARGFVASTSGDRTDSSGDRTVSSGVRTVLSGQPTSGAEGSPVAGGARMIEALYRRAHDLHFRGDDPVTALAAWDAYLAAEPGGRFAIEARYNRALVLARLGRYRAAHAALVPYARGTVAGGYRQAEAKALVDRLAELATGARRSTERTRD